MNGWLHLLWLGSSFLALFFIAEALYRFAKVQAEYSRKIVHAGTGLLTLLFPIFLTEIWQVSILCGSFLVLLLLSMRLNWFPSIHAVERRTAGSWLYPVIVVLSFVFFKKMSADPAALFKPLYYFYTPLLLLAFCDPAAALAGGYWRRTHPETLPGKTFAGSFSFFGLASAICIASAFIFTNHAVPSNYFVATGIATAYAATVAERMSDGGWDNFTIPAAAMLCMWATDYAL
jgi:dolichol kinase